MTTRLRFNLTCLAALLVAGCGGGSSSSSSSVASAINSAPSQAEFYDTDGTLVSRMQFQYPDELTINVQLQTAGTDMLWDTEDDTSRAYLQCQYMSAPTPLLRYPDIYFLGMGRSPTGSLGLAIHEIPIEGPVKCPVRSGRRLQQESGYSGNLFMSDSGDSYTYLVNAELEHFGGTATEVLQYEFVGLDTAVAEVLESAEFEVYGVDLSTVDEPDLQIIVDHTQTTTVVYDAEQRPLSIDMIADSPWTAVLDEYCADSDPLVIDFKLLRGCSSAHETRTYRYLGDSVEQDVQHYSGSSLAGIYTSTSTRMADSVIVHSGTAGAAPTSGTFYTSYPFNDSEQVTAKVSHSPGEDGMWGTEDDRNNAIEYHYGDDGRLVEVLERAVKALAYDYYPNGKLKQVDAFDNQSDIPSQRTLISYQDDSPVQIIVQYRFEDPDVGYVLQPRIVMEFAPSEETWHTLFSPVALFPLFPEAPPSTDDVMRFQPIK